MASVIFREYAERHKDQSQHDDHSQRSAAAAAIVRLETCDESPSRNQAIKQSSNESPSRRAPPRTGSDVATGAAPSGVSNVGSGTPSRGIEGGEGGKGSGGTPPAHVKKQVSSVQFRSTRVSHGKAASSCSCASSSAASLARRSSSLCVEHSVPDLVDVAFELREKLSIRRKLKARHAYNQSVTAVTIKAVDSAQAEGTPRLQSV